MENNGNIENNKKLNSLVSNSNNIKNIFEIRSEEKLNNNIFKAKNSNKQNKKDNILRDNMSITNSFTISILNAGFLNSFSFVSLKVDKLQTFIS